MISIKPMNNIAFGRGGSPYGPNNVAIVTQSAEDQKMVKKAMTIANMSIDEIHEYVKPVGRTIEEIAEEQLGIAIRNGFGRI